MPSGFKHQQACYLFLGDTYQFVHKLIDSCSDEDGPYHRKFFHVPWQILHIIIYCKRNDSKLNNTVQCFKAGLLHLIQDKGQEGIEQIEQFMSEILVGESSSFKSLLSNSQITQDFVFREVGDFIINLGFSMRSNKSNGLVKFTQVDEYFDLFIECSHSSGYNSQLKKKLDSYERHKMCDRPPLYSLMDI